MGKGEGKGKGKGGCGDLLDGACDFIQGVVCCLCCLVFSGPALTIVGIIFILSAFSNGRGDRIDEYNASVSAWDNGAVDGWASTDAFTYTTAATTPCTLDAESRSLTSASTAPDLRSEAGESDFDTYTPVFYEDPSPFSIGSTSCDITYTIMQGTLEVGSFSLPTQAVRSLSYSATGCSRSSSGSSSSSSSRNAQIQDVQRCFDSCTSQGGRPTGNSYASFQCDVNQDLQEACVRLTPSQSGFSIASGTLPDRSGAIGSGCFLSIGDTEWQVGEYGSSSQPVGLTIRHERDPALYFLDISDGSGDFGLSRSEKLSIGFTLLILGLIITACICGLCCLIVKFARGGQNKPRPSNPVTGPLYDVAAKYGNYVPGGHAVGHPAPGQHVQMGDPPPGYPDSKPTDPNMYNPGTAPAMYGQQNANAPPMYGQQGANAPPMYGQQGAGYAQPQYAPAPGNQPAGYPSV